MSFYNVNITDVEGESYVASGSGDIADVSYLAKSGLRRINGVTDTEFTVRLTQGAFINDKDSRTLLVLTADAETLDIVLSRKLAALRKSERQSAGQQDNTEAKENEEAFGGDAAPQPGDEEYPFNNEFHSSENKDN